MKVLVTGSTGFIGRYVVSRLLEQGHDVALLVREAYGMGTPLPPHLARRRFELQTVYADLRNYRMTVRAVQEAAPDTVIHLAAAGATEPFLPIDTALRHNVNGTLNLMRACFEKFGRIQTLITARTPGERTSMNVYAASKAAAWNFCQMYARTRQWPIVGAMVFQSYGWGQPQHALIPSAFRAAIANEDFAMTSGSQQRDWIDVRDVARGICCLPEANCQPGETIELGTGRLSSVAEVVQLIYDVTSSSGKPLIGALPGRPGEEQVQVAHVGRNASHKWQAQYTLRDGLKQYFDCYNEERLSS
ncbi:MAG: NAD-dependent epimerase/dehydratase family protein [Candidatus Promineifilaceae bacterium]